MPTVDVDTARGGSLDLWSDPPGRVWADYAHATTELVQLPEGEMEFYTVDRIVRPGIGEELLIPVGVAHTVNNTGRCRNRWLYGYQHTTGRYEP